MAKPDKNRHEKELTPEQLTACDCLVLGETDEAVAQKIGRSRQTVNHWQRHVPAFQAELNRRRAAVWQGASDRLRSLLPKALMVFERELESEQHGFRAALAIMKYVTLPVAAIGAQDAEEILTAKAKAKADAEFASFGNTRWHLDELRAQAQEEDADDAA